jgi:hypothetical protein
LRFSHPGLLNNEQELLALKLALGSKPGSLCNSSYLALAQDFRASSEYLPHPTAIVIVSPGTRPESEKSFKDDAMASYLNALQWVATGDASHRDKALEIMDSWAKSFVAIQAVYERNGRASLETTRALEAAWVLPIWANAAEIMRDHANGAARWRPDLVNIFGEFIERLYEQQRAIDKNNVSNRGISAALSMMTIGVFQNDSARYLEGLRRMHYLMSRVIRPDGEVVELRSRDCHHPQYSLTGLVQAAEVENNQGGESLWDEGRDQGKPVLARGLEYMAKALLDGSEARDCRGKKLLPGYADFAVSYTRHSGVLIPKFKMLARRSDPDGFSYQFVGWATAVRACLKTFQDNQR